MSKEIIFRMVAYTDAAGKYVPDAPLCGNEDNFFVDDNLGDDQPNHIVPDQYTSLDECGLLMVVADGMGGMNAGEVASQIAIDTVSEYFAPGRITPQLAGRHETRQKYLEKVIAEADARIKKNSKKEDEHKGMGSTIIMAWIVGNELTLSWCGDSRAYRFNPAAGIELLSKDHSYVQNLVDQGVLRYEDTFDHPQGNIVMRSLGDTSKKAQAETRLYNIYDNDIILLCSDGLSGVLRDKKTYDLDGDLIEGDNIEDILREHRDSLLNCREALWKAAEAADWYDNVTVVLCEIKSGAGAYIPKPNAEEKKYAPVTGNTVATIKLTKHRILGIVLSIFVLAGIAFGAYKFLGTNNSELKEEPEENVAVADTVKEQWRTRLLEKCDSLDSKAKVISQYDSICLNRFAALRDSIKDSTYIDSIRIERLINLYVEKIEFVKNVLPKAEEVLKHGQNKKIVKWIQGVLDSSEFNDITKKEWIEKLKRIQNPESPFFTIEKINPPSEAKGQDASQDTLNLIEDDGRN